jgi:hypothetical protein
MVGTPVGGWLLDVGDRRLKRMEEAVPLSARPADAENVRVLCFPMHS